MFFHLCLVLPIAGLESTTRSVMLVKILVRGVRCSSVVPQTSSCASLAL